MRDSREPDGAVFAFAPGAWREFAAKVKSDVCRLTEISCYPGHDEAIGMSVAAATIPRMLVATWILAIASAILAISGPVALFAWLSARSQDRERRQRERDEEARERVLKSARDEFVPKSWLGGGAVLGALALLIAWGSWTDRQK